MSSPSPSPHQSNAYVREAQPHEFEEVAWVLTRGFMRDPATNWYGSVKQMVPADADITNYKALPQHTKATIKGLHAFQTMLIRATVLSGGLVMVAVIPNKQTGGETSKKGRETIAGVTTWLKPGQTLDFPVMTIIRSGVLKVFLAWGLSGAKRLLLEFSPAVERSLIKSFKAHKMDRLDSWHLLEIVVDPAHEGKGLCGLMMRDGFGRTTPKPVHLEATTSRSRDIYAHFGFEVDEDHRFGKGVVDANGVAAKGTAATGYPEWVMTKWKYS